MIASHTAFLLSYLTTLYLLEFVATPVKFIEKLLKERQPDEFKFSSSKNLNADQRSQSGNNVQQSEEIQFLFQPVMNQLLDFKVFLKVIYPNTKMVHQQYSEISLAFTDYFDCYVQPSKSCKLRRLESLPTS